MYSSSGASAGTVSHTNGLRRDQADNNMSAATAGAYQSTATLRSSSIAASPRSHSSLSHDSTNGAPPTDTRTPNSRVNTTPVTMASRNTPNGTTTSAVSAFDVTVMPSETGIDFQNRMLRSLRSAYRQSSA